MHLPSPFESYEAKLLRFRKRKRETTKRRPLKESYTHLCLSSREEPKPTIYPVERRALVVSPQHEEGFRVPANAGKATTAGGTTTSTSRSVHGCVIMTTVVTRRTNCPLRAGSPLMTVLASDFSRPGSDSGTYTPTRGSPGPSGKHSILIER